MIDLRFLFYPVQRAFCHCEERSDVAISRKGYRIVMTECVAQNVTRVLFVVALVAKYERYIVAYDAKEFQKTFRLGHGKVARQYRRNGQGKICEFNDVEPRKFHKSFYDKAAYAVQYAML